MLSLMLNAAAAPATPAEGPSQLLVLGMHHSGTSIVSNLTMMMGAYGGARDELLLHPQNPLKFWERRDVVELDDAVGDDRLDLLSRANLYMHSDAASAGRRAGGRAVAAYMEDVLIVRSGAERASADARQQREGDLDGVDPFERRKRPRRRRRRARR